MRIDIGETMMDMATRLRISTSFLSAVETGKKTAPAGFVTQLANAYNLTPETVERLNYLKSESVSNLKIDLGGAYPAQRKAAIAFSRKFDTLSDENAREIMRIFGEDSTDE